MTTTTADPKFWDGIAAKYAAKPVDDMPSFERKKAITREYLNPNATVLEIGCGTGSLALDLCEKAGHIHAQDISPEMIRIAREKKSAQEVTNVTFHVGTLDTAPFDEATFDCAWAYSILHLIEDRRGALARLFAVLKPGGTLISSNVCLADTWVPYGAMITVMRWFGKAPRVWLYDRDTIVRELGEVGFVDVAVHDVGGSPIVSFITARKPR